MSPRLIIFLLIGTAAMLIPIFILMLKYKLKLWKSVPIAFLLTFFGTLGTYLWFFVENFTFGGRSFYGAVFIVPFSFILIAKLFKTPYNELLDLCAPAECVMLAIMKIMCIASGCCSGRILFVTISGDNVRFPSQIVELAVAVLIFIIIMVMGWKMTNKGTLYPWYLILYGTTRFLLNFLREEWALYDGGMIPLGTVWSIVSVIAGVMWLCIIHKRSRVLK